MRQLSVIALSKLLRSCIPLSAISQAKQTHLQILINGFLPNTTLQTDLLLVYSRFGRLHDAQRVFDEMPQRNMHSWNILISSYVQNSNFHDSLRVFSWFLKEGLKPDHFTFPSLFKACAGIGDSTTATTAITILGKVLHGLVIKLGFVGHVVLGCSILDFYAKRSKLLDAHLMFADMPIKDVVIWNSMISGFARAGFSVEALGYFKKMHDEGVMMDSRTVSIILSACGREGDLSKGKEIHAQVIKNAVLNEDIVIGNCLIDMYSKCGCLCDSQKVFDNMLVFSLITWTTLISCYGIHGKGEEALVLFDTMTVLGHEPNCVTITAVLAGCSHSGLIDQARRIFDTMTSNYNIEPSVEHYTCLVDLLGRYGHLEEALGLIDKMPQKPSASVWGALLGACRIHKNVEIGEVAAQQLFELEAGNSSNYIALCSIYHSVGRWDGVLKIRRRMRELGLVKKPGCSWISVEGKVNTFYQGDISDTQVKMVYEALDRTVQIMIFQLDYG